MTASFAVLRWTASDTTSSIGRQKERDGYVFTEINTVVNAFHIEALEQMAELAPPSGNMRTRKPLMLAQNWQHLRSRKRCSTNPQESIEMASAPITAAFTPTSFLWRLVWFPEDKVAGVLAWLEEKGHAVQCLCGAVLHGSLLSNGSDKRAIELMIADGDRSWKHMVDSGTTISWEAWDLKYKPNQDWNHAWGAAPANLLPRYILGAQAAQPGWTVATIRPCTGGLKFARGRVPTPQGPIEIDWNERCDIHAFA